MRYLSHLSWKITCKFIAKSTRSTTSVSTISSPCSKLLRASSRLHPNRRDTDRILPHSHHSNNRHKTPRDNLQLTIRPNTRKCRWHSDPSLSTGWDSLQETTTNVVDTASLPWALVGTAFKKQQQMSLTQRPFPEHWLGQPSRNNNKCRWHSGPSLSTGWDRLQETTTNVVDTASLPWALVGTAFKKQQQMSLTQRPFPEHWLGQPSRNNNKCRWHSVPSLSTGWDSLQETTTNVVDTASLPWALVGTAFKKQQQMSLTQRPFPEHWLGQTSRNNNKCRWHSGPSLSTGWDNLQETTTNVVDTAALPWALVGTAFKKQQQMSLTQRPFPEHWLGQPSRNNNKCRWHSGPSLSTGWDRLQETTTNVVDTASLPWALVGTTFKKQQQMSLTQRPFPEHWLGQPSRNNNKCRWHSVPSLSTGWDNLQETTTNVVDTAALPWALVGTDFKKQQQMSLTQRPFPEHWLGQPSRNNNKCRWHSVPSLSTGWDNLQETTTNVVDTASLPWALVGTTFKKQQQMSLTQRPFPEHWLGQPSRNNNKCRWHSVPSLSTGWDSLQETTTNVVDTASLPWALVGTVFKKQQQMSLTQRPFPEHWLGQPSRNNNKCRWHSVPSLSTGWDSLQETTTNVVDTASLPWALVGTAFKKQQQMSLTQRPFPEHWLGQPSRNNNKCRWHSVPSLSTGWDSLQETTTNVVDTAALPWALVGTAFKKQQQMSLTQRPFPEHWLGQPSRNNNKCRWHSVPSLSTGWDSLQETTTNVVDTASLPWALVGTAFKKQQQQRAMQVLFIPSIQ